MKREDAYDLVQKRAMDAWEAEISFKELIMQEERITAMLTQEELNECFNPEHHLQQIDYIFKRLGLT